MNKYPVIINFAMIKNESRAFCPMCLGLKEIIEHKSRPKFMLNRNIFLQA